MGAHSSSAVESAWSDTCEILGSGLLFIVLRLPVWARSVESARSDTGGMLNKTAKIFDPQSNDSHISSGVILDPQAKVFSPCSSKGTRNRPDGDLIYTIDGRGEVPSIAVYSSCLKGT